MFRNRPGDQGDSRTALEPSNPGARTPCKAGCTAALCRGSQEQQERSTDPWVSSRDLGYKSSSHSRKFCFRNIRHTKDPRPCFSDLGTPWAPGDLQAVKWTGA